MLLRKQNEEKTYEQYMEEALRKIPLYSQEWTNFNPADVGMTILENITALNIMQNNYIDNDIPGERLAMLKLLGFSLIKGRQAVAYIETYNADEPFVLPQNQQFIVGNLVFECDKATLVSGGRIIDVTAGDRSYNELLRINNTYPIEIFSKKPQKNMEINLFFSYISCEEKDIKIYVKCYDKYKRNPTTEKIHMSEICWQCYTDKGFENISCEDETQGFLFDGLMTFDLSEVIPEKCRHNGQDSYVIRGVLQTANYDIAPGLLNISGTLFLVKQQHTRAVAREFYETDSISLYSDILENNYVRIFVWNNEKKCYELCNKENYIVNHDGYGMFSYQFNKKYESILISAYSEEIIPLCRLGNVYGFDNEEIDIVPNDELICKLTLILEKVNRDGHSEYYHMMPDIQNTGGFVYSIDDIKCKIHIIDSGEFNGCAVYIGEYVTTRGLEGNIPEGKRFIPLGYDTDAEFYNPVCGMGGRNNETTEEMENRFLADINESYTAVLKEDYNKIVKSTPSLCIDKVNTYIREDGIVHIAVKPFSDKIHPTLSELYRKIISDRLEDRRIMNTHISLESPVYTPINVYGRIVVKEHYVDAEKIICEKIRECTDYVSTDKNFGEILKFDKVFEIVERLECVKNINNFIIRPSGMSHVRMEGADVVPDGNCLLYPGEINVDIQKV